MGNQHEFGRRAYAVTAEQIGGIEPNAVHARLGAYQENAPRQDSNRRAMAYRSARHEWRALRDVLEHEPMTHHLCDMADIEPERLCWRFAESLQG